MFSQPDESKKPSIELDNSPDAVAIRAGLIKRRYITLDRISRPIKVVLVIPDNLMRV